MSREILKDVPLYHVKPYDKNYQDHKDNIDHIANSIKDFGYNKVSITVDEDMVMLTGHGTLGALEKLKYKQVPLVLQITGLTEKQKKAFRIADNESSKNVTINDEFLRLELDDIGVDFNMADYGLDIPDIKEIDMPDLGDGSDPDIQQMTFTLSNEQADHVKEALDKAKKELDCIDEINQNSNGNKLAAIMRYYIGR